MKNFFQIIFSIILIFILVYLTIAVNSSKNLEKPNFQNMKFENIFFDISDSGEIKIGEGNETKILYLNDSDKILSLGDFDFSKENGNFNLKNGYYLININSLNKKFFINGKGFKIETEGANTVYIDTSSDYIKVFSVDNITKLHFLGENNSTVYNTIFLYPNQYISFRPKDSEKIKNVDSYKITQNLSLGYFNGNIVKNGSINPNFKTFILSKDKKISDNQEKLFTYISKEFENKEKELKDFSEKNIFKIPGEDMMLEYYFLFFNKEKESIFLKNKILKNLQEIIKNEDKDENFLTSLEKNLQENLTKLRTTDKKSYDEIMKIIYYLEGNINLTKKGKYDFLVFFTKILDKNSPVFEKKEKLIANYTFFKYNFVSDKNIYSDIKNFIETKSELKIENNEKNYFVLFLNKIISANIKEENINFEDTISIFKVFSDVGVEYFSAENLENEFPEKDEKEIEELREKTIQTGIINFNSILNDLISKIETSFFTRNTAKNNILEKINNEKNISKNYLTILENSIDKIYNFYDKNKDLSKNAVIKKRYLDNLENFNELKQALNDYENYLVNNDEKIKNLININNSENKIDVNLENAVKYLERFNSIVFSEKNIEVMGRNFCENPEKEEFKNDKENPYCYKISEIGVGNGNIVSFLLYPTEYNKLTRIIIGGDKNINRSTYKLDEIEENFKDLEGEKEYDFENFFINVLIPINKTQKNLEIFENKNQEPIDSDIIRTLKNSKLLGKNGTLTTLSNILKIKYEEISVTEDTKKNIYIIKIKGSEIFGKSVSGNFNSDYKYENFQNSFFNPEIILTKGVNDELNGQTIKISGFIPLDKFQKSIEKLFEKTEDLGIILTNLKKKDSLENLNIVYFWQNDKIQISTKNIKITTIGDKIENIISFGKKILVKNEKMSKIEELLK